MAAGGALRVRTNVDDVFRSIDAFVDDCRTIAAPRALTKLRDQAKTAGFRKIADIYKIGVRELDKYATLKPASAVSPDATITIKGKGFPLYIFQARQTRKGVSVTVKGRRHVYPGTFIARLRSGRVGVFARGSYGGKGSGFVGSGQSIGRFQLGRKRLPINELFTFAPPDTLRNAEVTRAMSDRVAEQAPKVFAQEARFLSRTAR